jgi:predicted RNA-binding protein YlxR (DUF448 family)
MEMAGLTNDSHSPTRTCVGCRQRAAKHDLIRFTVALKIGVEQPLRIAPDPSAVAYGRGAYMHNSEACRVAAAKSGALQWTLKVPRSTPVDFPEAPTAAPDRGVFSLEQVECRPYEESVASSAAGSSRQGKRTGLDGQ